MKRIVMVGLLCFGLGLVGGCGATEPSNPPPATGTTPVGDQPAGVYTKITPPEAKAKIEAGGAVTLVDVRLADEYASGHLPGAVLIPLDEIEARAAEELPDKQATLLIYCRSGVRSSTAAHILVDLGYTAVFDIGGILDWPYEIVTD